jgi:uncharacterized protein YjbI with pentapeptide repeats
VEVVMKAERPRFSKDPLYQMLRVDDTRGFNQRREQGATCDLTGVDLRGLDLRGLDAEGLDFTGSYFRDTDLRGVDLSGAILDGCSFYGAKISGTLFPAAVAPEEIRLSVEYGTRIRCRR